MRARYAALLLFVLLAISAHACSCAGTGATCGALKPGGTLLLAEVISQRSVAVPMGLPGRTDLFTTNRVFRMRVVEAFSGEPRNGEEIDIRTGNGGGDCGFGFVVGRRYLVDAYDTKPDTELAALRGVHLSTGICSLTREEGTAGIALRELRTEVAHGRQPDLHGAVRLLNSPYSYPGRPLSGIEIVLTGERDGAVYRAQIDAEGIYTFATLPPGSYTAALTLPAHQTLIRYNEAKPLHVDIPANNGTGLACHLDAEVGATGGVRVRVVDHDGEPQPGLLTVRRAGTSQEANAFGSDWSDHGTFELEYLPDGEYQIVFSNYTTHQSASATATVRDGAVSDGGVMVTTPLIR